MDDFYDGPHLSPDWWRSRPVIWTAVAAVLVLLVSANLGGPDAGDAHAACRRLVTERLTAPATADFSDEASITGSDGRWTIRSHVDAENSFGANVRTPWTCSIEHDGDGWHLQRLDIE